MCVVYLLWLWNVYNNAIHAHKKGDALAIVIVAVMYKIKEELEKKIWISFTKEEVDRERLH